MVKEILEMEYVGEPLKRVILFNFEWYDPIHPGEHINTTTTK